MQVNIDTLKKKMAGAVPNVPGTWNNIPVSSYTAGISESYPNVNRQRIVESSINSKERVDFMPVNMGVNQVLADKYIEFRINGVTGSFIDLSSLLLELSIIPVNSGDNSNLSDDINVAMVNGLANTLFKSVSVFINEKMIESNPIFNYTSYIKLLKSMDPNTVDTIGKCGFFYDNANNQSVTQTYDTSAFAAPSGSLERKLMAHIKSHGIDMCFPLLLDISTLDMYLLDGVDVRIRLELANRSWIIKTDTGGSNINSYMRKVKLWVDRVTPHYNALTALNESLNMKPLEYIFHKTLHKTYVIGMGESSIMIDQPFGSCIPEKLTMIIVDMDAFSGSYNQNGLYFKHANLSNMHITINGSSVYNINTSFPHHYSQSYYETQKTLGLDNNNLITYDTYNKGRAVFCFNFVNENVQDTLPVEISASLRLNLKFEQSVNTPHVIILLADTTGLLTIDNQRLITCDVRG